MSIQSLGTGLPPTQSSVSLPPAAATQALSSVTISNAAIEPAGRTARNSEQGQQARDNAAASQPALSFENLQQALDEVQSAIKVVTSDLVFSIDEDSGHTLVKIVDRETDEVIKQIPSEEMVRIAKALDKLQGLLVKQEA